MAKQEITAVQVQMAASAGVKLLQIEDLPVPLAVAKSGALGILESMLNALATGEVILAHAPPAVAIPTPGEGAPTPDEDPPEGATPKGGNSGEETRPE